MNLMCKYSPCWESALEQIRDRRYYEKYLETGKRVHLVGFEFDQAKRNIGAYVVETAAGA